MHDYGRRETDWMPKVHSTRVSPSLPRRPGMQLRATCCRLGLVSNTAGRTILTCQDVANKSATICCNGICEKTRHNGT